MERLTERDEYGNADIVSVDSAELQLNLEFNELNKVTDALDRLAAHEDNGLTPEQVKILVDCSDMQTARLDLARQEIEAQQREIQQHIIWNEEHTKAMAEQTKEIEKLRKAIEQAREALEHIQYPLKWLKTKADNEEKVLDVGIAIQLSNQPHYLKEIAHEALTSIDKTLESNSNIRCKSAEKQNGKCLGYQISEYDDEPSDLCKECKEHTLYELI